MTITDYYVTTDAMGSVTAILDDEGNVLERRSYDAFGEMTCMTPDGTPVEESHTGVDVGFQGQISDKVTSLYQMGYRWYNPVLGRWLSRDPIRLSGGVNINAFCSNNPIIKSDPNGLQTQIEFNKSACEVTITLKYFFELSDKKQRYEFNRQRAMENTANIFSSKFNGKKCPATCDCPNGVSGRLILKETARYEPGSVRILVVFSDYERSFAHIGGEFVTIYETNKNYESIEKKVIPHEIGHILGLNHPGRNRPNPPPPNVADDYKDPSYPDNVMGSGFTLKDSDFERIFCDQIQKR